MCGPHSLKLSWPSLMSRAGVGEADWIYKSLFSVEAVDIRSQVDLVFHGLDTFATVWLVRFLHP
jgi:hypothetical protein